MLCNAPPFLVISSPVLTEPRETSSGVHYGENKLDTITLDEKEGGLRVQKASLRNESMLTSLAWRYYHNLQSFWVKVLSSKYSKEPPSLAFVLSEFGKT